MREQPCFIICEAISSEEVEHLLDENSALRG